GGRPVKWVGTNVAESLPIYGAGPSAQALGVNGDGSVIVGWSGFGYPYDQVAVRWVNGQVESLGIPPGFVRTWATGVSANGSVIVGVAEAPGLVSQAFVWTQGTGITLLPNNASPYTTVTSVSADGRVIAGRSGADSVVWKDGVLYRVQAELIPAGTVIAPFTSLAGGARVSRDGTTIASAEVVREAPGDGEYHAWVVVLPEWFTGPGACAADFTADGAVDGDDVIGFFGAWDAGELAADFNGDGGVDGDDVIAFFGAWDSGC
ncbi:MAG: GC-type dockerin domain-anchored protein, partial [Phycisphaerales bacterium]